MHIKSFISNLMFFAAFNLYLVAAHEFGSCSRYGPLLWPRVTDVPGVLLRQGLPSVWGWHWGESSLSMVSNISFDQNITLEGFVVLNDSAFAFGLIAGETQTTEDSSLNQSLPTKCDPELSFDAVTELRGETIIFKDRCENSHGSLLW